jgi:hypothetical protein
LPLVPSTSANPDGSFPTLSMPIEHVNYTITSINGTLWAVIYGNYPIYLQNQSDCAFNCDLPMVYPMPSGSTDIHVTLGDRELSWSNYPNHTQTPCIRPPSATGGKSTASCPTYPAFLC